MQNAYIHSSHMNSFIRRLSRQYQPVLNAIEYCEQSVPATVVIRLDPKSGASQRPSKFAGMIAGTCQMIMLVFLTLLFGSMYGQRLFLSTVFVVCFMLVTVLSRGLSIWSTALLHKQMNLTVIDCDSIEEMRWTELRLRGMKNVQINNKTSGYCVLNGRRANPPRLGRITFIVAVLIYNFAPTTPINMLVPTPLLNYPVGIITTVLYGTVGVLVNLVDFGEKAGFDFSELPARVDSDGQEAENAYPIGQPLATDTSTIHSSNDNGSHA